jgi:hypothetical protein
MKDISAAVLRFVAIGERCAAIGASYIGTERSFGTICETGLQAPKSRVTERKFTAIGESSDAIAGNLEVTAGIMTIGTVIAAAGTIATGGGILTDHKIRLS